MVLKMGKHYFLVCHIVWRHKFNRHMHYKHDSKITTFWTCCQIVCVQYFEISYLGRMGPPLWFFNSWPSVAAVLNFEVGTTFPPFGVGLWCFVWWHNFGKYVTFMFVVLLDSDIWSVATWYVIFVIKVIVNVLKNVHVLWVPVTTAWRVLGLRLEDTAFRYEG